MSILALAVTGWFFLVEQSSARQQARIDAIRDDVTRLLDADREQVLLQSSGDPAARAMSSLWTARQKILTDQLESRITAVPFKEIGANTFIVLAQQLANDSQLERSEQLLLQALQKASDPTTKAVARQGLAAIYADPHGSLYDLSKARKMSSETEQELAGSKSPLRRSILADSYILCAVYEHANGNRSESDTCLQHAEDVIKGLETEATAVVGAIPPRRSLEDAKQRLLSRPSGSTLPELDGSWVIETTDATLTGRLDSIVSKPGEPTLEISDGNGLQIVAEGHVQRMTNGEVLVSWRGQSAARPPGFPPSLPASAIPTSGTLRIDKLGPSDTLEGVWKQLGATDRPVILRNLKPTP